MAYGDVWTVTQVKVFDTIKPIIPQFLDVPRQWCMTHFQGRHETGWERLHSVRYREISGLHLYRNSIGPWIQRLYMPSAVCRDCQHNDSKHEITFVRGTGAVRMELVKPICVSINIALCHLGYFPATPISPGNICVLEIFQFSSH